MRDLAAPAGDLALARRQQAATDATPAPVGGDPEVLNPIVVSHHDRDDPTRRLRHQTLRPLAVRPRRRALEQMAVDLGRDPAHQPLDRRAVPFRGRPDQRPAAPQAVAARRRRAP